MILDFCSGMGGVTEGMRQGGIHVTHAIDWSADACASHRANLPGTAVLQRDIRQMAKDGGNWTDVKLAIFDTPCSPYSSAGNGLGAEDERDLLTVSVDLICRMRPNTCLISNVPGLTFVKHADALGTMVDRLREAGYCVEFMMMNGADFGLPQTRKRPWWFAHLDGPCIKWPTTTHAKRLDLFRRPWVTIGDAFTHAFGPGFTAEDIGRMGSIVWKEGTDHRPGQWDQPARTLTGNPNGDGALLLVDAEHSPAKMNAPSRTILSKQDHTWYLVSQKHCPSSMDAPSLTIGQKPRQEILLSCGGRDVIVMNERARCVLQGFPPGWIVQGDTARSRDSQIGLAMPPPMARAVAKAIKDRR